MLEVTQSPDGLDLLVSPLLAERGVPHAFTTRGPRDIADFTTLSPLVLGDIRALFRLPRAPLIGLHQVHGADVHDLERTPRDAAVRADALVSSTPGMIATIRTADCVPILLSDAHGGHVAAVHAGWKGLLAGVLPAAIAALRGRAGGSELVAAVGPCIRAAAFEVGADVASRFRTAGLAEAVVPRADGVHVDLPAAVRAQLTAAGITDERVDVTAACTYRDAASFFSHRRDVTHGNAERTGRMAALIAPHSR